MDKKKHGTSSNSEAVKETSTPQEHLVPNRLFKRKKLSWIR